MNVYTCTMPVLLCRHMNRRILLMNVVVMKVYKAITNMLLCTQMIQHLQQFEIIVHWLWGVLIQFLEADNALQRRPRFEIFKDLGKTYTSTSRRAEVCRYLLSWGEQKAGYMLIGSLYCASGRTEAFLSRYQSLPAAATAAWDTHMWVK